MVACEGTESMIFLKTLSPPLTLREYKGIAIAAITTHHHPNTNTNIESSLCCARYTRQFLTTSGPTRGVNCAEYAVYHLCVRGVLSEANMRKQAGRLWCKQTLTMCILFSPAFWSEWARFHIDMMLRGLVGWHNAFRHFFIILVLNKSEAVIMNLLPTRPKTFPSNTKHANTTTIIVRAAPAGAADFVRHGSQKEMVGNSLSARRRWSSFGSQSSDVDFSAKLSELEALDEELNGGGVAEEGTETKATEAHLERGDANEGETKGDTKGERKEGEEKGADAATRTCMVQTHVGRRQEEGV